MNKDRARQKAEKYFEWADKAEAKAKEIYDGFKSTYKDFDWTQPILRGHHSQRRHEKVFERRDSVMRKSIELEEKAKRFREKANNLLHFANTNKGDAERKRQVIREQADLLVRVGMNVDTVVWGMGEVVKINKKTYTVKFPSGSQFTVDKSWVRFPTK